MRLRKNRRLEFQSLEDRTLLASGSGIWAQYFNDSELQSLASSQAESGLTIDWSLGSPPGVQNPDQFSARFSGQVEAGFSEVHTFRLSAAGGARLWINGVKLIDRWDESNFSDAIASSSLIAGRRYDIQLEFRETGGAASFDLRWSSPSMATQSIPTGSLFPTERGTIERRVWNSLVGDSINALTSLNAFPHQPSSLLPLTSLEVAATGADDFGQLLAGRLYPPTTGSYQFYIAADDVAELWLSNSSNPAGKQRIAMVANPSGPRDWLATNIQRSAPIALVAGQSYAIEVLHKESQGNDHVAVAWMRPGSSAIEVIDGQFLSPPLPTVRVFSQRPEAVEGDAHPLEFVIQRSGAPLTNPLSVSYVLGGSATATDDYNPVSGTVIIPAGESTAVVQLFPVTDGLTEGMETVSLEIVDAAGYEVGLKSERQSLGTIHDVTAALPGGTQLSPPMLLANYQRFGGAFSQILPSTPFNSIIQATISTVPAESYGAQLKFAYSGAIQQGDLMWAEFYLRSIGSPGLVTVISERNGTPYTKSLSKGMPATTEWRRIQLPFLSAESYAAGEAVFGFYLGSQLQTLQFADLTVRNYGPPRDQTPTPLRLYNNGGNFGTSQTVPVANQPFESAVEIVTTSAPPNNESFRLQYGGRSVARVNNGDLLQLEFYARAVAGANPRVNAGMQNTTNFASLNFQSFNLGTTWQKYVVNATANADYAAGGLQAMLNVGFAPQTVQFAGFKWTNLSAASNLQDLPTIAWSTSYQGRDSEDGWRTAADQRIADTRQSSLSVHVVDANGNPIDGAVVSVQQTSHQFLFGSAIDGFNNRLNPSGGPDAIRYQNAIKRLFNAATLENSLKWPSFEQDRQRGIDAANWVVNNGLYLRGHNVIWPSQTHMPASVWSQYQIIEAAQGEIAAKDFLRTTIEARVLDAIGTFANLAGEWDIVNEPYTNNAVMQLLGNQIVVDWFQQARQVDPDVERVLNDYDIFARNGNNTLHRANFDAWLSLLKSNNAIERIGEQSHYSESNLTDITVLGQLIQTYQAQFGLPIAITEFDIGSSSRQLQADYLRDYLTMAFSQSAVDQFIQWGFWSGAHYDPERALYNDDFSIRPHGQAYEDLVFGNWWTDARGTTASGSFTTDVFHGDYTVTVFLGDQVVSRKLKALNADGSLTVEMPGTLQLILPLYQYPLSAPGTLSPWWQQVLQGATASTPVTIVANPGSGPIDSSHPDYANWIAALTQMRTNPFIRIVGYVKTRVAPTSPTVRSSVDILADVNVYANAYKHPGTGDSLIDGIFLDEMSNDPVYLVTYAAVADGIRSLPGLAGQFIVGNPGTQVPVQYLDQRVADLFIVREGSPSDLLNNPDPAYVTAPGYSTLGFGAIIHSALTFANLAQVLRELKLRSFDYAFVTDDTGLNPYDQAPTYFSLLLRDIHAPFIAPTTYGLAENSPNGTVVGTPVSGDPNVGQTLTYAIVAGNVGSAFTIDSTTGRIRVNNSTALDFETNPTFSLTVRVTDNGNPQLFDEVNCTINLMDLAEIVPSVELITINDGSGSRSQVTSLTIRFNTTVDHSLLNNAFSVTNIDTGIPVGTVHVSASDSSGPTIAILTFSGASTFARLGSGLRGNSLVDGNYRLDILSNWVRATTGNTPMAADYLFGGQTASAPNNDRFFRLLGDANGDGVRNGIDLNAIIPTLFNPPGYRADLDTNGDGVINGIDLNGLIPTLFGSRRL